jgi:hypothetical protein
MRSDLEGKDVAVHGMDCNYRSIALHALQPAQARLLRSDRTGITVEALGLSLLTQFADSTSCA